MRPIGPGYLRIGELTKRTGVSPELLRAWEQRCRLLQPTRTPGGFRLYSAADEARVQRIRNLVSGGLAAAQAARLLSGGEPRRTDSGSATTLEEAAGNLSAALDRLDEQAANSALDRLFSAYTVEMVLQDVVLPYLHRLEGNDGRPARSQSPRSTSPPTCSEKDASTRPRPRLGPRPRPGRHPRLPTGRTPRTRPTGLRGRPASQRLADHLPRHRQPDRRRRRHRPLPRTGGPWSS